MSSLLGQAAAIGLTDGKHWPDDVKIFQPFEVDQILMDEFANCLSLKTFLNMLGLKYQIELRFNAEYMSPSGGVPFLQIGPILISEFNSIVSFINAKGFSLTSELALEQLADLRSYIDMVQVVFDRALLYIMWVDEETYNMITKTRSGFPYSWPLSRILPWKKRWEILDFLNSIGWKNKSLDEVVDNVDECCKALSDKLGDRQFFIGERPSELDAVVFGYLFTVLTTPLLKLMLPERIQKYKNLTDFCQKIHEEYFVGTSSENVKD